MKFKSVVWASTIDYPDEVSTVLFVGTCNWDCEYCYNKNLKNKKDIDFETEILPRLLNRKDFVNHVVISGGECTLYDKLENTIDILRENGFTVGIHTNGSRPEVLKKILPKIKFVGMDIKSDYFFYHAITSVWGVSQVYHSIYEIIQSNIQYEFRTTLYPLYCNLDRCRNIATELKGMCVKEWVLQEYTNEFDKKLVSPYSKEYILEIVKECNKILPTRLKGE